MLRSRATRRRQGGFTVMEVLVAIGVLTIGVVAMAALSSSMQVKGRQSKYMTLAATLASEKLEDLNRWNVESPYICVPSGTASVGSLTSDVLQTTNCVSGASDSVSYFDDISITLQDGAAGCPDATAGCFAETVSGQNAGATEYTTTYHSPGGHITTSAPTATAPVNMTFHRRWLIEADTPVAGVRRVTVRVTLLDLSSQPGVNFQMSVVRP